jgi:hypothetical protein
MLGKSKVETSSDSLVTTSHAFLTALRECNSYQLANTLIRDFSGLSENQAKKLLLSTQVEIVRLENALSKYVTQCVVFAYGGSERERLGKLRRFNYNENKKQTGELVGDSTV